MNCTTGRWGGCLPRSHPPEVLEGLVHAGSDDGSADLLEVVTESLEHLVLQVAEVDLDLVHDACSVTLWGEVEPPLHPAAPVRQGWVGDPRQRGGRLAGDDDGVR